MTTLFDSLCFCGTSWISRDKTQLAQLNGQEAWMKFSWLSLRLPDDYPSRCPLISHLWHLRGFVSIRWTFVVDGLTFHWAVDCLSYFLRWSSRTACEFESALDTLPNSGSTAVIKEGKELQLYVKSRKHGGLSNVLSWKQITSSWGVGEGGDGLTHFQHQLHEYWGVL